MVGVLFVLGYDVLGTTVGLPYLMGFSIHRGLVGTIHSICISSKT
jgi:ABC-type enterochelin transport system permease subunit